MNVISAITRGVGRTVHSPALVLGLWLVNFAFALPLAILMSDVLEDSIGESLFQETLREGFDADWYAELTVEERRGIATTFRPSVLGAGAVYDNLDDWWSGRLFNPSSPLLWLGVAYAVVWVFLLGGVLDAYAGPGGPRYREGFFAACGKSFSRFLQLAVASGVLYFLVFGLSGWLFGRLRDATRELTEERPVFWATLAVAGLVVVLLHLVRMVFDYAKIAVVLGDEKTSAPAALLSAVRFVARNPGRTVGVYAGVGLLALVLIAVYALAAPGAGQASFLTVALAFLVSQIYLAVRVGLRLSLLGAEVELLRGGGA